MDAKIARAAAGAGALLAALSPTILCLLDLPLRDGTPVRIEAAGEAALSGTLWRGAGGPKARGALLPPGFGSERTVMRPLARALPRRPFPKPSSSTGSYCPKEPSSPERGRSAGWGRPPCEKTEKARSALDPRFTP